VGKGCQQPQQADDARSLATLRASYSENNSLLTECGGERKVLKSKPLDHLTASQAVLGSVDSEGDGDEAEGSQDHIVEGEGQLQPLPGGDGIRSAQREAVFTGGRFVPVRAGSADPQPDGLAHHHWIGR
jgi:hypothetical protein